MNRLVGKIGSLVTGVSVLSFAVSMIVAFFTRLRFTVALPAYLLPSVLSRLCARFTH